MNLSACARLPKTPENRTWFRAIQPRYSSTALNSAHTKGSRSRFSGGPLLPSSAQFQILYFAEDHQTARFEFGAMVGSPHIPGRAIPNPGVPALVLNVQITLQQVFDLTQVRSAQVPLQTTDRYQSRSPMTSVTAPIGLAETQTLGEALFQTGIEGFRSLSAKIPYARTLMVFPTNLGRGSSIIYIDSGTVVYRIDGTI